MNEIQAPVSAQVNFIRAVIVVAFGSLILLASPSHLSLLIYNYCRARAIFRIARGLEDVADAIPPINPS
jgi:hypothetical protein